MSRFGNTPTPPGGNSGGGMTVSFATNEIVEPRCSICKSKWRRTIDQLLVMGVPFSEIARQFEEEGITRRGLSNHKRKHLSVEQAAIRRVIEEKARQIGEDVDSTSRLLLTRRGYMEVALMKSYQSILDGTVVPEPRDIIQMISLMEKMEKDTASVQVDEMMRDFNAFTQAVKEIVGQGSYDKILFRFNRILEQDRMVTDNFSGAPIIIESLPTSTRQSLTSQASAVMELTEEDNEDEEEDGQ